MIAIAQIVLVVVFLICAFQTARNWGTGSGLGWNLGAVVSAMVFFAIA